MWTVWLLSTGPTANTKTHEEEKIRVLMAVLMSLTAGGMSAHTHTVQWQRPGPSLPGAPGAVVAVQKGSV